jgi:hypothetical protein
MLLLALSLFGLAARAADRAIALDEVVAGKVSGVVPAGAVDVQMNMPGIGYCQGSVSARPSTAGVTTGDATFADCEALRWLGGANKAELTWKTRDGGAPGSAALVLAAPGATGEKDGDPEWTGVADGSQVYFQMDGTPWHAGTVHDGVIRSATGWAVINRWETLQSTLRVRVAAGQSWTELALTPKKAKRQSCDTLRAVPRLRNGRMVCIDFALDSEAPFAVSERSREGEWWPESLASVRHADSLVLLPGEWLTVVVLNAPGNVSLTKNAEGVSIGPEDLVNAWKRFNPSGGAPPKRADPEGAVPEQMFHFAPRAMGKVWHADFQAGTGGTLRSTTLEVEVRRVYIGAVRLGVGATAVPMDHEYEVLAWPGTGAKAVVDVYSDLPMSFEPEIALGYSAFFRPRSYALGDPESLRVVDHVGLYAGLGVVGADGVKVKALTSAYLGLEYEVKPDFGITLAAVLQRGEALNYPYAVGDRVPDGTALTRTVFRPGVALIINLSPAFFRAHPTLGVLAPASEEPAAVETRTTETVKTSETKPAG